MKLDRMGEIGRKYCCEVIFIDLKKPCFVEGAYAEDPNHSLMTTKEMGAWYRENKAHLWWDDAAREVDPK